VNQRHRVAVFGTDRQAQPVVGHLPGEGDDPGGRSANLASRRSGDVDAAVLAARIRVVLGDEPLEHRPLDGPAPRSRAWSVGERDKQQGDQDDEDVAKFANHAGNIPSRSAVVKFDYREAR
jgi:hypothetical protein